MSYVPCTPDSISIHAPLRGRLSCLPALSGRISHFNPRPLAGATWLYGYFLFKSIISIHAPLRGRRIGDKLKPGAIFISIHAPLRGRQKRTRLRIKRQRFQSTPPCGGDCRPFLFFHIGPISIHAPLRGRLGSVILAAFKSVFQSTPPCGGDTRITTGVISILYFNPRPLAGATG